MSSSLRSDFDDGLTHIEIVYAKGERSCRDMAFTFGLEYIILSCTIGNVVIKRRAVR